MMIWPQSLSHRGRVSSGCCPGDARRCGKNWDHAEFFSIKGGGFPKLGRLMKMRLPHMLCRNCHTRLSACLDGELSERDMRNMKRHLDGCAFCRARLADLEALEAPLASPGTPEMPGDLEYRIMARASREYFDAPDRGGFRAIVRRWLGATATASALAVGLLLGGLLGWNSHGEPVSERVMMRTENAVFASLSAAPGGSVEAAVLAGFDGGGRL
ncbi:MAG: zf-HC2 domain-containing protein [Pseudodesulfovibrio sp.]